MYMLICILMLYVNKILKFCQIDFSFLCLAGDINADIHKQLPMSVQHAILGESDLSFVITAEIVFIKKIKIS